MSRNSRIVRKKLEREIMWVLRELLGVHGHYKFFPGLPKGSFVTHKNFRHGRALTIPEINCFVILVLNLFLDLFISSFESFIF